MKFLLAILLFSGLMLSKITAQKNYTTSKSISMNKTEIFKIESRIQGLNIAITHAEENIISDDYPVLFLHGSSFPSALAFGFKMNNYSWMDNLSEKGYDVYALDFLGYGNSDRYPEMKTNISKTKSVGRALDIYKDVDKAVNFIMEKTGKNKVYLIAHSWAGSIGALYASKFPEKVKKLVLFAPITARHDTTALENIEGSFHTMTPMQRLDALKSLTPAGKECQLEKEVFGSWGKEWLKSDPLAAKLNSESVRIPSGPSQDIEDLLHNKSYYNPADIKAPTLIIRGEWDEYPNNSDAENLLTALTNASSKKYVVLEKGTHVMHLEKIRYKLYSEVIYFLQDGAMPRETNKHSIAVIFEVIPAEGHKQEYLDIAASLKPELEKIKGFISIERFQSIYHPEKILSLSFWANDEAIQAWRNLEMHRNAQAKGREFIFRDYHLRIGEIIRDYGMFDRNEAPFDSKAFHR